MDDAAIEQRLRAFFETRAPEVAAAYLFGSVARGTSRATSDVDVGVLLAREPAATFADKLVVDRNPSARIAFEVRARNEFFDLKPVLDQYRAARAPGR